MNEQGFYKYHSESELEYAPNGIISSWYVLSPQDYDKLILPIDGWYWFDTKIDAETFFNIK